MLNKFRYRVTVQSTATNMPSRLERKLTIYGGRPNTSIIIRSQHSCHPLNFLNLMTI
ncbi:hypothetical protein LguiB_002543 [Lonicera macranthoides]